MRLIVCTGLALAMPLAAQTPLPRYDVHRTTGPIVIDGRIDEAAWAAAAPGASLQALWDDQTGPVQATSVRVLWNDSTLFLAYEVEDADITAQFTERDDPTYRDDAVEVFINPDPDQTGVYYGLEMNARAVYYDYLAAHDGRTLAKRFDLQGVRVATWLNGTLNARGDVDEGWTLEVSVPFDNFADSARPPTVGTVWSANFNRWDGVPPDRRMSIWSDPEQARPQPHVPSRFGEWIFVE